MVKSNHAIDDIQVFSILDRSSLDYKTFAEVWLNWARHFHSGKQVYAWYKNTYGYEYIIILKHLLSVLYTIGKSYSSSCVYTNTSHRIHSL